MNKWLFAFLLIFSPFLFSQDKHLVDSLQQIIRGNFHDSLKANALNKIAYEYRRMSSDSTRKYASLAFHIYSKINNMKGIAMSLNHLGIAHHFDATYDSALFYYQKSLDIREKIGEKTGIASSNSNMGIVLYLQGEYDAAIKKYEKAFAIQESIKDTNGMANTSNNLASVYRYRGRYDKALELFIRALELYEKAGDEAGRLYAYNNIGIVYATLNKSKLAIRTYREALAIAEKTKDNYILAVLNTNLGIQLLEEKNIADAILHFEKGYKLAKEIGTQQGMATGAVNLGRAYFELKDHVKALTYVKQAQDFYEKSGEKQGLVSALNLKGQIQLASHDLAGAELSLTRALKLSNEAGMLDHAETSYAHLSELFKKRKNFPKALEYFRAYSKLKDSLLNSDNSSTIARLQTGFETEKKEKQIVLLQKAQSLMDLKIAGQDSDIQKTNIILLSSSSVTALSILFAVLVVRTYRRKRKTNNELQEKNVSIISQKELIEQKNNEIRNNLLIAGQIQQSILPKPMVISKTFREHTLLYMPKDIVSGDFYWVKKAEGRTFAAVIDCTGHGVPGAYMSVLAYELLEDIVRKEPDISPANLLSVLNRKLHLQTSSGEYADKPGLDISFVMIPDKGDHLIFAGSRQPLWMIHENAGNADPFSEIKPEKHFMGLEKEKTFKEVKVEMSKGDRFYMFSDGYTDQIGDASSGQTGKKKMLSQRFKEFLLKDRENEMSGQSKRLEQFLLDWKGNFEQIDDITVFGFKPNE